MWYNVKRGSFSIQFNSVETFIIATKKQFLNWHYFASIYFTSRCDFCLYVVVVVICSEAEIYLSEEGNVRESLAIIASI